MLVDTFNNIVIMKSDSLTPCWRQRLSYVLLKCGCWPVPGVMTYQHMRLSTSGLVEGMQLKPEQNGNVTENSPEKARIPGI